jgi:class 3 adenylate cyclase
MTTPQTASRPGRRAGPLVTVLVLALLAGLPLAAWLDLRDLSERILRRQADEIGRVIDDMRNFYASDVVARVVAQHTASATHNYRDVQGGIPIPATLSIELGKRISARNDSVRYRFVSDLPFRGREPHNLDAFEQKAIETLRADPKARVTDVSGTLSERIIRTASPVTLGQACVSCHNTHPDSPKTDWKAGDVRGIQEITVVQPIATNIWSFKYMLSYFAFAAFAGAAFIGLQRKQSAQIASANRELTEANDFLASISMKIAKYISPQIYKSIFSGQRDAAIATERKKLTIFFSDIKDFTATTERLQPEDLTALLNEYFTEMSAIALQYGATVDKFIGDAMLLFFGDPETKGTAEDARMDYTIIGAEANLAARLQSIAEPGGIVMSYETYSLVRDMVRAHALPPITMKGISREVAPYAVDGLVQDLKLRPRVISEQAEGVDLFLDLELLDKAAIERTRALLQCALAALEDKHKSGSA